MPSTQITFSMLILKQLMNRSLVMNIGRWRVQSASGCAMNSDQFNMVQTAIAGAFLAITMWNVYTAHELTKNQALLAWRVEELEKEPREE